MHSPAFDFSVRTNAKFGAGRAKNLPVFLKEQGLNSPGIIVDEGVAGLVYTREVLDAIHNDSSLKPQVWIYDLGHEPDYDSLDQKKQRFMDSSGRPAVDCFVGIGGGSVIDFAKGLSTVLVNSGPAVQYKGFPTGIRPSLPTIAIPTTAGTGSEVTYNAVFTDNETKKKLGINTRHNFPAIAILDPLFTVNSPLPVTVSSGMDALVHTLESYAAVQSNPMNRVFAREAFCLVFNNLHLVKEYPGDISVRAGLQTGAYLAGISLINSGSGPAGALSYPLGVHFKVPHGIAGAVFLPHIIRHNVEHGYDYSELYCLISGADPALPCNLRNRVFTDKISSLADQLGVPKRLTAFGVNAENISVLLSEMAGLAKAFEQNPVPFTVDNARDLLMRMI